MHIIGYPKIRKFSEKYHNTKNSLQRWYNLLGKENYNNSDELRATFSNSFDKVGECIVFNVGGNKVRLIAKIFYGAKTVHIKHVLTHAEYDLGKWKKDCLK